MPGGTLLSRKEARRRAGDISRTFEHWLIHSDPDWPPVIRIGAARTAYSERGIDLWIQKRIAAARPQELGETEAGRAPEPATGDLRNSVPKVRK